MKQEIGSSSDEAEGQDNLIIGWREIVALPDLMPELIHAKVDTGARTSAVHATHIEQIDQDGEPSVRFRLYANHQDPEQFREIVCPLNDIRTIRNSSGDNHERYVIRTRIRVGDRTFTAAVTLADRGTLRYPMLLGRTALRVARLLVDSQNSYLHTRPPKA